ncbi:MAG: hypothetical protein OJF58_005430 [Enhydrobacter sp.]|nr:MAG: hypothetical protein OJF58_005430 [Enhydrobacter sp.]
MMARGRHSEHWRGICNRKERSLAALGMTHEPCHPEAKPMDPSLHGKTLEKE